MNCKHLEYCDKHIHKTKNIMCNMEMYNNCRLASFYDKYGNWFEQTFIGSKIIPNNNNNTNLLNNSHGEKINKRFLAKSKSLTKD